MWIAIGTLAALVIAILKYFPPKTPGEKKGEAIAKIHDDSEKFKTTRDTSDLGNFD